MPGARMYSPSSSSSTETRLCETSLHCDRQLTKRRVSVQNYGRMKPKEDQVATFVFVEIEAVCRRSVASADWRSTGWHGNCHKGREQAYHSDQ